MANDQGGGAGSILLAFVLGAISGAAVGQDSAPASGGGAAVNLVGRAGGGRERAAAADRGREMMQQGRETLSNAIERGREAYQQARTQENA
jgi:hypothetical protein